MAGGLVALLDDVAALAKLAAASVDDVGAAAGRASAKAAGVVVDDTAVTPRYVQGFTPDRELPIIKQIALGSLRNKLLIILPAALLLSQFLPWLLTPILMVGGTYLAYEGAEKIWEMVAGHEEHEVPVGGGRRRPREDRWSAARSAPTSSSRPRSWSSRSTRSPTSRSSPRAIILVVVAIGITVLVYGVVGLIVKMDDIGLHLAGRQSGAARTVGRGPRRGHAEAARRPVDGRHRRDALGRWPHPPRRRRRARLARPVRPRPPRGGGRRRRRPRLARQHPGLGGHRPRRRRRRRRRRHRGQEAPGARPGSTASPPPTERPDVVSRWERRLSRWERRLSRAAPSAASDVRR